MNRRTKGGGAQNALFKIAAKQYFGHLMILGGGEAQRFIEDKMLF